jgi:hypothetical protein
VDYQDFQKLGQISQYRPFAWAIKRIIFIRSKSLTSDAKERGLKQQLRSISLNTQERHDIETRLSRVNAERLEKDFMDHSSSGGMPLAMAFSNMPKLFSVELRPFQTSPWPARQALDGSLLEQEQIGRSR